MKIFLSLKLLVWRQNWVAGARHGIFQGKISNLNRLVCKKAVALAYYGSCRLLVMGLLVKISQAHEVKSCRFLGGLLGPSRFASEYLSLLTRDCTLVIAVSLSIPLRMLLIPKKAEVEVPKTAGANCLSKGITQIFAWVETAISLRHITNRLVLFQKKKKQF